MSDLGLGGREVFFLLSDVAWVIGMGWELGIGYTDENEGGGDEGG